MRKWFLWIGIPLAVIAVVAAIFYQGMYGRGESIGRVKEVFSIERGEGLREIARHLEEAGLIRNRVFFIAYAVLVNNQSMLKAGSYFLDSGMSIQEITRKISSGDTDSLTMQIIEGWNISDIAEYLNERGIVGEDEFYAFVDASVGESFSKQFSILEDKPTDISLEGYLFPDTYDVDLRNGAEDIVMMMVENLEKRITRDLRDEIRDQKKSVFQILTMASLLEREVRTKNEKEIVAGVLWKRLASGMLLQVDSTVLYATKEYDAEISLYDLKIQSPYNTYVNTGLPKGPISNPGMESILAAVYFQESPYWYYLSTREGETLYSRTLEEHNIKKAKYLK